MAPKIACSNPRFTEDFVRKCRFCVLLNQISQKKLICLCCFSRFILGQVPGAHPNILVG